MCSSHAPEAGADSAPPCSIPWPHMHKSCEGCGRLDYADKAVREGLCATCASTPCLVCGAPILYGAGHDDGCRVGDAIGNEPMRCKHCSTSAAFRQLDKVPPCDNTRTGRHFWRAADMDRAEYVAQLAAGGLR